MALALLALATYAYWYQTNDRRIRRNTERYLSDLTGGPVRVHKAHFSLFGGIELDKVRVYVPGAPGPDPFFRSEKVTMRHNPWNLLVRGRVDPQEIVCVGPVITLEYHVDAGGYIAGRLFEAALSRGALSQIQEGVAPPRIRLRDARVKVVDVEANRRDEVGQVPMELSMVPRDGSYEITFEQSVMGNGEGIQGKLVFDPAAGRITQVLGSVPLDALEKTLPRRYRAWRRRYKLAGRIDIKQFQGSEGANMLTAELRDVSMRLPKDEGDLELAGVFGTLVFDPAGVELKDITGRIPQGGNAPFNLSGKYDGYGPESPFVATIRVQGMQLPQSGSTGGDLGRATESIRQTYHPEGAMDLTVTLRRDSNGKLTYEGLGEPRGLSMVFKHFPYRIEDVRGRIEFAPGVIDLVDLTARRGEARCRIEGRLTRQEDRTLYDVKVKATDVLLDEEFRSAVPENFQGFYKALDPLGRTSMNAHVYRGAEHRCEQVELHLVMDGKGSVCYEGFPYRIGKLVGDAYVDKNEIRIEDVHAARGDATCTINGVLKGWGTNQHSVEVTIDGESLPLDRSLAEAAGEKGLSALEQFRPGGLIEKFSAHVWTSQGSSLDYSIVAHLRDGSFNLRDFPYEINSAAGVVTLRPDQLIVEQLRGAHGQAQISLAGQVYPDLKSPGLDVRIAGRNVAFDEDLGGALPEEFREIWEQFSPGGTASVEVEVRKNLPDPEKKDWYRLSLDAHDMRVLWSGFPYPLSGIRGRVCATPKRISLEGLSFRKGQMHGALAGTVDLGPDGERAQLSVSASGVPIDEQLLAAAPGELRPLAMRFVPAGTCDVQLESLELYRPKQPTSSPSDDLRSPTRWGVTGTVKLRDAKINIGLGPKSITGKITGSGHREEKGLALEAEIALDELLGGKHRVTALSGKLVKSPTSSMMRFDDFSGKSHGGRLAGFALIELTDPLRYKTSLLIEGIQMDKLFAAGGWEEAGEIFGLLGGRIELSETVGQTATRTASGVLRISRAQLYRKLPILLDLMTVVYLALPHDAAFAEGEFTYYLRGDNLVFREIYLRGLTLSLVGSGSMDMRTKELKLYFLVDPLGELPRLSGLPDEVFTGILRQISEVEITGTLSNPRTRTRALGSLEDAIRKLISPTAEQ